MGHSKNSLDEHDRGASFIWRSRAPLICKIFTWLALKNRVWTSDRLARRGLPHHDACPLCDQEQESIDHLLISCVFARSVWFADLSAWCKGKWTPKADYHLLAWCTSLAQEPRLRKDLNMFAALVL